jgi:hypothetical protein
VLNANFTAWSANVTPVKSWPHGQELGLPQRPPAVAHARRSHHVAH